MTPTPRTAQRRSALPRRTAHLHSVVMRVLLFGDQSAERVRASRLLTEAGMTVEACRSDDWVCSGMEGRCPLDTDVVDVAIAVAPRGQRIDAEGIACAQRARIPTVTVGATARDPALRFATSSVARIDDRLVEVVRAASMDASAHQRAVEEAFATHLAPGEVVEAVVRRRAGSIEVSLSMDIRRGRSSAIVELARAAVRGYDPNVKIIDVSVSASSVETVDGHEG